MTSTKKKLFKVDLTKIEGEGDFSCPNCGILISPEDETEKAYKVLDLVVGDDTDCFESMVLQCNGCHCTISLDGFDALSEEGSSRAEISEALPESKPGYETRHTVSLDGQPLGRLVVECAQEEDVQAFKRLRNLDLGKPFKGTIIIEKTGRLEFTHENLQEIVNAVKRKFKALGDRDIYIAEINGGQTKLIGRASNL